MTKRRARWDELAAKLEVATSDGAFSVSIKAIEASLPPQARPMSDRDHYCQSHARGRSPGGALKYDPDCLECVRRRGHLPEAERDIPADTNRRRWAASAYVPDRHAPAAKARAIKARNAVRTVWGR